MYAWGSELMHYSDWMKQPGQRDTQGEEEKERESEWVVGEERREETAKYININIYMQTNVLFRFDTFCSWCSFQSCSAYNNLDKNQIPDMRNQNYMENASWENQFYFIKFSYTLSNSLLISWVVVKQYNNLQKVPKTDINHVTALKCEYNIKVWNTSLM